MEKRQKYTAFISYNSKDNQTAKWLQKKLESYSLPSVIADEKGETIRSYDKKQKKFRIFRYVTDLVAQNLDDGLRQELDQSKFLIVICSPNSSNAPWVRKEVKHFIDTERKKQIIPFVIKGVPYSGDGNECFTPELKEAFPNGSALGVSLNDYGDDFWIFRKRKAIAKIVSLLIELPNAYDFIWNRYRNRFVCNAVFRLLLLLGVFMLIYYTYKIDKIFTCKINVIENTQPNYNIPMLKNAHIFIAIGDDIKNKTLIDINDSIIINDIPNKFYKKSTRVYFEGYGYHPLDTIVELNDNICLHINRDEATYGQIQFIIIDIQTESPVCNEEIRIEDKNIKSDENGLVKIRMPLFEQKRFYKLDSDKWDFIDSIIEPPFTESSIVEVIKK